MKTIVYVLLKYQRMERVPNKNTLIHHMDPTPCVHANMHICPFICLHLLSNMCFRTFICLHLSCEYVFPYFHSPTPFMRICISVLSFAYTFHANMYFRTFICLHLSCEYVCPVPL